RRRHERRGPLARAVGPRAGVGRAGGGSAGGARPPPASGCATPIVAPRAPRVAAAAFRARATPARAGVGERPGADPRPSALPPPRGPGRRRGAGGPGPAALRGGAVGAGGTPFLAVDVGVCGAPPLMSARLARVRDACALGAPFADALDALAARAPPLRPVAD